MFSLSKKKKRKSRNNLSLCKIVPNAKAKIRRPLKFLKKYMKTCGMKTKKIYENKERKTEVFNLRSQ